MSLSAQEWEIIWLSLKVAITCVSLLVVPATLCGYALARWDFRGKALADSLIHLPLVLPPVVVGYGLLLLLGRNGLLGGWLLSQFGWTIAFSWEGAAVASAVMGFPLMVRSVRLSVEMVDRKLEAVARSLGASPRDVFCSVTLPLIMPGIFAGITLAFARSLGEFGATITFAGNIVGETRTLPLAIYSYLQTPDGDAAAMKLVIISVVLSIAALMASEWLTRKVSRRLNNSSSDA